MQAAIAQAAPADSPESNLLTIAFCRSLIACSNAAFNHQSMSFKKASTLELIPDYAAHFKRDLDFVLQGAQQNPTSQAKVLLQDARHLASLPVEPFDMVITSPPYANRMSYIRELRPYMYWLRMLIESRDAGGIRLACNWWHMGHCHAVASLNGSRQKMAYSSERLEAVLQGVSCSTRQFQCGRFWRLTSANVALIWLSIFLGQGLFWLQMPVYTTLLATLFLRRAGFC
ncbi:MAG: hypothetical protein WKG07_13560 [Hymenobacter sp.]